MPDRGSVALPTGFIEALAAATSRRGVLAATATWMPHMIDAERSSIALPIPGSTDSLRIYAMADTVMAEGTVLPIEGSLVGTAYTTQNIVNVENLDSSTTAEAPVLRSFGLRSAIVCPLVIGGRSIGTVNLGNAKASFFTSDHETLLRVVVDLIASFMAVHDRAESEHARASTDHLTGLLSRSAILNHLHECFEDGHGARPSLLYLDIDGFKMINDTHGHGRGDEVLRVLANRVRRLLRADDRVGRLGGDEFLVVIAEDPDGTTAAEVAARISERCAEPIAFRSVRLQAGVSIGIASAGDEIDSADGLLHDADQAMYSAKGTVGRIGVANDELRKRAAMIATIDRDLDAGMRSRSIGYHFQPIRDLTTREILGAEALIRWSHPDFGMIPAPLLIERLEATGRTDAFTQWSLHTVMQDWSVVQNEIPWFIDKAVSVNLTPRQLGWAGYADFHLRSLRDFNFRPQDIIVEVVESSEIQVNDPAEATLQRLGESDVVIALDDFGTGHNALGYFTRFPIHAIKFDRSLVGVAPQSVNARKILAGLTAICNDLGVVSLGEGVETEVEARLCQQLGMTSGQGWHFGYPVPRPDFISAALDEGPPSRSRLVPQEKALW